MSIERDIKDIKENQEILIKQLEEIKNIMRNKNGMPKLVTNQVNYNNEDEIDPFFESAVEFVIENRMASTSIIQRKFKLGYARAGRIIERMEDLGVISEYRGSKPRDILITMEQWKDIKQKNNIK